MICILSSIKSSIFHLHANETVKFMHNSALCCAARKGTREKARKKKVKVEVTKVGFIPHNQREKKINVQRMNKHLDDSWKQIPKDNAYVGKYYRWPVYSVADAIQCHRETHHPTIYNEPNASLNVEIELNMQAEKKTRFVDNFSRMATIPHKFSHGEERKILVFANAEENIAIAREAGATLAGGVDLIKRITNGELLLSDYQYTLAHPDILTELVAIRGLMKRRFPNPRNETLGPNLAEMIARFTHGISYMATKDEYQQDFGIIKTCIGTLDMDVIKLEENLKCLLTDINAMRPKREGKFITRVLLKSPPSSEQLKIDPFLYVPELYSKSSNGKFEAKEADDDSTYNVKFTDDKRLKVTV